MKSIKSNHTTELNKILLYYAARSPFHQLITMKIKRKNTCMHMCLVIIDYICT